MPMVALMTSSMQACSLCSEKPSFRDHCGLPDSLSLSTARRGRFGLQPVGLKYVNLLGDSKVCEFTMETLKYMNFHGDRKRRASSERRVLLVLGLTHHTSALTQARAQGSHKEKKPKEAARTDPLSNPRHVLMLF